MSASSFFIIHYLNSSINTDLFASVNKNSCYNRICNLSNYLSSYIHFIYSTILNLIYSESSLIILFPQFGQKLESLVIFLWEYNERESILVFLKQFPKLYLHYIPIFCHDNLKQLKYQYRSFQYHIHKLLDQFK